MAKALFISNYYINIECKWLYEATSQSMIKGHITELSMLLAAYTIVLWRSLKYM